MHDRPPRRSVRLEIDEPRGDRPGDKIVENDVEADARRQAVGGRRAQIDRAEAVAGERGDVALGPDLGVAIGRDRVQRAGLVDHVIAGQAVIAARRGEQEALDPGLLGEPGEMHAGAVIDAVGVSGLRLPSGSLDSAARWMTASMPRGRARRRRAHLCGYAAHRRCCRRRQRCSFRKDRCRGRRPHGPPSAASAP